MKIFCFKNFQHHLQYSILPLMYLAVVTIPEAFIFWDLFSFLFPFLILYTFFCLVLFPLYPYCTSFLTYYKQFICNQLRGGGFLSLQMKVFPFYYLIYYSELTNNTPGIFLICKVLFIPSGISLKQLSVTWRSKIVARCMFLMPSIVNSTNLTITPQNCRNGTRMG